MIRVHCGNLVTVNDSYGAPYLIWNRYLMVPPYLIWNRYCMVPLTCMYGTPHMYDLMVSPYLTWNRYCIVLPHVCIVPPNIHLVPPHVQYDFFRPALKESTACPNKAHQSTLNSAYNKKNICRDFASL